MSKNITLADLVKNSAYRRTWLLYKASKTTPLNDALSLARAADEFITGTSIIQSGADCSMGPVADLPNGSEPALETAIVVVATPTAPSKARGDRIQLATDERERLIERLSSGATNAELASEFGLSRKQVQGLRLGLARKGTKWRASLEEKQQPTEEAHAASADEVVRYLRQQDDIVVQYGEAGYLVNGRFQLSLPDLISRANKMRNRQGKPDFKFVDNYTVSSEGSILANGHSAF